MPNTATATTADDIFTAQSNMFSYNNTYTDITTASNTITIDPTANVTITSGGNVRFVNWDTQQITNSLSSGTGAYTATTPHQVYYVNPTAGTGTETMIGGGYTVTNDNTITWAQGTPVNIQVGGTANWYYTTDSSGWININPAPPMDAAAMLREKIRQNLQFWGTRKRAVLAATIIPAEQKARDTLRDLISENQYRRYITNGFIMVPGKSGKHYQIFSTHSRRIRVYEKGEAKWDLCIHTDAECPATDHVLTMKILIEIDEDAIWKDANVSNIAGRPEIYAYGNGTIQVASPSIPVQEKSENLHQYFRKLRAVA